MNTIDSSLPGASGAQSTGLLSRATGSSVMGKDEFLLLLVTQLRNQDPMNPMDGQQFAAQLAQFSSVEQLINIDRTLAAHGEMNGLLAQSVNSGVAAGLIGKSIQADGNAVHWSGGDDVPLHFELAGEATKVTVKVRDADGTVVREMEVDARDAGRHSAAWDGKNAAGVAVPKGTYTFEVEAVAGKDGKDKVGATPFIQGKVDRITFGQDGIMLWIGEQAIPMGAVRTVKE